MPGSRYPTLLALMRHAESQRNIAKGERTYFSDSESRRSVRGIADPDVALTDEGRRQALLSGRALRARYGRFDAVIHSGYRRTRDTAHLLLEAWPPEEQCAMDVRHDLFIRERDAGFAFEMTAEEADRAFPWLAEYWRTTGSFFARPPGGESLAQVCERVYLFLDRLYRDRAGQRVLVITHAATLRAFRFLLERWTYEEAAERFQAELSPNCGVTVYALDPGTGELALRELHAVYWASEPKEGGDPAP